MRRILINAPVPASELGKDKTLRARAINRALELPGPRRRLDARKAQMEKAWAEYQALIQPRNPKKSKLDEWLDAVLKK